MDTTNENQNQKQLDSLLNRPHRNTQPSNNKAATEQQPAQQPILQTTATEHLFGEGMGAMVQLADEMSDAASDQLVDLVGALTIQKTAKKMGAGQWGSLTRQMMQSVKSGFLAPVRQRVEEIKQEELNPQYLALASTPSANCLPASSEKNNDSNGHNSNN